MNSARPVVQVAKSAALWILVLVAAPMAQAPPETGFETILWWNNGIEPSERAFATILERGLRAVSVSSVAASNHPMRCASGSVA